MIKVRGLTISCFIAVNRLFEIKSCPLVSLLFNFEINCIVVSTDTSSNRPVHVVNYCVAISVCHKCPGEDIPCDDCEKVRTFSSLTANDALVDFCKWAFDDPVNRKAIFVAHNASNYDSHLFYHILWTLQNIQTFWQTVESCSKCTLDVVRLDS